MPKKDFTITVSDDSITYFQNHSIQSAQKIRSRLKFCVTQCLVACLSLSLIPDQLLAQQSNNSEKFFDVIAGDSLKLYCSFLYNFTSVNCPDFIRYSRLDEKGNFNGTFKDIAVDSVTLATGRYIHGIKDGYWEIFYNDGTIKSKGWYKDNRPAEDWFYFYPNGLPERHLKFTSTDTLVIMANTPKGESPVVQGNGEFDLLIKPRENFLGLWAKGEIKDGKRAGKWVTYFPSLSGKNTYSHEVFIDGKLVSGEHPDIKNHTVKYRDSSSFRLFMPPEIISLETFKFFPCGSIYKAAEHPSLLSRPTFERLILAVFAEKDYKQYGNWVDLIKLRITIDKDGIPTKIESSAPMSPLSMRLVQMIRGNIRWKPAEKKNVKVASSAVLNVDYRDTGSGFAYRYSIHHN